MIIILAKNISISKISNDFGTAIFRNIDNCTYNFSCNVVH